MTTRLRRAFLAVLAGFGLAGYDESSLFAQEKLPHPPQEKLTPTVLNLSMAEAKQRVLSNSKAMQLVNLQVQQKLYAKRAMQTYYLPKAIGSFTYLHFDNPLGSVVTLAGPRGILGPKDIPVNLVNQDLNTSMVLAAQPLTGLLKVRQGVKAAQADEQIAFAQLEKTKRLLTHGTEQLYLGLYAAQRIQAGTNVAVQASEQMLKTQTLEARANYLEAMQAKQAVDNQVADLREQLLALLDLPQDTPLDLEETPLPLMDFLNAEQAGQQAVANSPEVQEASHTIAKARAGLAAKKLDYLPDVNLVGGYVNLNGVPTIQNNFSFAGVMGSVTLFEWGKRRFATREMLTTVAMAEAKLHMTEDEVRQKAVKAYREIEQKRAALKIAADMAQVRREMMAVAKAPAVQLEAAKERIKAEVALVQADLSYRMAIAELTSLTCNE